jgi:hypothetical protein
VHVEQRQEPEEAVVVLGAVQDADLDAVQLGGAVVQAEGEGPLAATRGKPRLGRATSG